MSLEKSLDEIINERTNGFDHKHSRRRGSQNRISKKSRLTYKSKRASKEHNSSPDDGPWQHDLDQEQDAHPRTTHLQKRQHSENRFGVRVENLHYQVLEKDVLSLFENFRPIRVIMNYDRAGRSEGSCDVYFETSQDAEDAQKTLQSTNLKGSEIQISKKSPPSLFDRISDMPHSARKPSRSSRSNRGFNRSSKKDDRSFRSSSKKSSNNSISHEDLDKELDEYAMSFHAASTVSSHPSQDFTPSIANAHEKNEPVAPSKDSNLTEEMDLQMEAV